MISLSPAFIARMQQILDDESEAFFRALDSVPPTTIRLNPNKRTSMSALPFPGILAGQVPWCADGYYLAERPAFTLDPYFHGGGYYVQEASSMFLHTVIRQLVTDQPVRVLDLCAAPGGKSTLLATQLPPHSLLVANEIIHSRATILKENVIKWGASNIVVTNSDPNRFTALQGAFDIILVDAPCSGEGMFRKDERSIEEWSENNLRLCEDRQRRVLSDIWNALQPGGYLVYSTCTYNPGENEEMLRWATATFNASPVDIRHPFPGIVPAGTPGLGYHFYPHRVAGEGLFMSVLQKQDGEPFFKKKDKRAGQTPDVKLPADILPLLPDLANYLPYLAGTTLGIVPRRHAEFIQHLSSQAGVIYKGLEIGENIKGKTKPAHALALFQQLQQEHVARHEVDLPTALQYLRKEDIRFDAPAGEWILITYQGIALGWVKEVGHRINNYYPKEWRIRNM